MRDGVMPLLRLQALTKVYGRQRVVSEASLDVEQGEFVSIIGPSGSGKSTILKIIAGTIAPTSGNVVFRGSEIAGSQRTPSGIVMVWQSLALFPHMNVSDNVAFGLTVRGVEARERKRRVGHYLAMVDLPGFEHRSVQDLSGGEQQRVALARALIVEPQVLLLDEPLGGLDKHLRAQVLRKLRELHRSTGVTIVMVTHDQGEAMVTSSRIAVLNCGRIEQVGSPTEVTRTPKTEFVARFVGHKNVFKATIRVVKGSQVEVETAAGVLTGTHPHWIAQEWSPGQRAVYVIDADKVSLNFSGRNRLTGILDIHSKVGATEIVDAVVGNLGIVRCERHNDSDVLGPLPEQLSLSWSEKDGYVLPEA